MVITQTPMRMSFLGGGTDYREFFENVPGGGISIATTFDKYCYVNMRKLPPFFDYSSKIIYSKIEHVSQITDIEHPLIRECLRSLEMDHMHITYDADLPARTGLGTSSAFAVGLYLGLYAMKGKYLDKKSLADKAIALERSILNEYGGWQDQIACAYGGLNRIDFDENGYHVQPIIMSAARKQEFESKCMLFFTGFSRFSSDIAQEQVKRTAINTNNLIYMRELAREGFQVLSNEACNIREFGRILHESWMMKRSLTNKITTDGIDSMYQLARKHGAGGGKLLGAGGGGFLLIYADEDRQEEIKKALESLKHIPFQFENEGARILYYRDDGGELQC
ncbi:kinase [Lachnospiraceae bacterium 45-W7]